MHTNAYNYIVINTILSTVCTIPKQKKQAHIFPINNTNNAERYSRIFITIPSVNFINTIFYFNMADFPLQLFQNIYLPHMNKIDRNYAKCFYTLDHLLIFDIFP